MRVATALTGLVGAAVLMGAWIASAPPASNPDGVFHLVSIWCAEGTNDIDCVEIPGDEDRVLVPRSVQQSACYAYDPLASGACAQQFLEAPIDVLAPVNDANLSGARPQLYYRTMHLLQDEQVLASTTRMRMANAAAAILLLGLTSFLATPSVRRGLHASWLLTAVPLGVWLLSTTNTGAWLIAGVGTAWANLLTATEPSVRRGRRIAAGALAIVGTVMGLGARTEAVVPIVAALLAVTALRVPRLRAIPGVVRALPTAGRGVLAAAAVLVPLAIVLVLPETARVTAPIAGLSEGLETLRGRGAGNPLLHLTVTMPSLLLGGLGIGWGLGWIDTLIPVPVGGLVFGTWVATLAAALRDVRGRRIGVVVALALLAVVFPIYTLGYNGLYVGEQFQPRHYVILLFLIMGFAAVGSPSSRPLLGSRQRVAVVTALSVAHAHLLHQNTRRYVTGLRSEVYFDLGRDAEWWWTTFPIGPTANWLMGAVAFTVVAWVLSRDLGPRTSRAAA